VAIKIRSSSNKIAMNFEALLLPCLAKSTLNLMWESSHKVPSWAVSKMKEVLAANFNLGHFFAFFKR